VFFSLTAFVGITIFLTLSRGGIISCIAGQIFLTAVLLMKRAENRRRAVMIPILATVVLCLAGWLAYDQIETKFQTLTADGGPSNSRLNIWKDDLPMLWSYAVTGIGRGAYAEAHARYNSTPNPITYVFAENSYVQAVAAFRHLGRRRLQY